MKNVIFAFCAIGVLMICTAVSAIAIDRFIDDTAALIQAGEYRTALDNFKQKKEYIALVVNGDVLRSLHEGLSALAAGDEGAKEMALSACEEIAAREKFNWGALF